MASEATTASKQPQRSNLTSDLEFVAQITYETMFVWAVWASVCSLAERRRLRKKQTDNYYTCVALRAAGKKKCLT